MIDIYGVIDLHRRRRAVSVRNPFKYCRYYDFEYISNTFVMDNAKIFCLERLQQGGNYYCLGKRHLFIFGFAVTSRKYSQSSVKMCVGRLMAEDIFNLYQKHGVKCVEYMKGSYTIIFYDEQENHVALLSDHLNVLPIHYSYRDGMFIFSSTVQSILDSSLVDAGIDETAIAEFCIFDYTLGNRTFYKAIKQLDYGEIVEVGENGLRQHRYFSISDLFDTKMCERQEALGMLSEIMHDNSRLYVADAQQFLLALTGGFDCRMNLALINRKYEDFLCYSYGRFGSRQIEIPTEIAKLLGLNYRAIFLDDDFRREYTDCAYRAVFYSDGTAPILRANYPYAYRKLSVFSKVAITGLFGSEVMRPIRNLGLQINRNSERIFMSGDFDKQLTDVFVHEKNDRYINCNIYDNAYGEIRDYLRCAYPSVVGNHDRMINLYRFFIAEGVRKYFMQEIRIERVYVETRFPYFDLDFVRAIFSTPFAGLYNGAFKQSPIGRRNAQSLYAFVIDRFKPELGRIQVDRGYKPNDLLSPLWFLRILPGYLKARLYYKSKGDDTFDAENWTAPIFAKERRLLRKRTEIFPGTLYNRYVNMEHMNNNYRFSRLFSLKYWFEHEGN